MHLDVPVNEDHKTKRKLWRNVGESFTKRPRAGCETAKKGPASGPLLLEYPRDPVRGRFTEILPVLENFEAWTRLDVI